MMIAITLLAVDLKLPELGDTAMSAQVWQARIVLTPSKPEMTASSAQSAK